jgi:hypothetical protein
MFPPPEPPLLEQALCPPAAATSVGFGLSPPLATIDPEAPIVKFPPTIKIINPPVPCAGT